MLIGIILLVIIILLKVLSKTKFLEFYIQYIHPLYRNIIGRIFNIIPYSTFPFIVVIMVVILIYLLIKKRKYTVNYLLSIFLVYTLTCGMLYNRKPIYSDIEITNEQYIELYEYLIQEINDLEVEDMNLEEIIDYAPAAMQNIQKGYYPNPKKVIGSRVMSYFDITGIYSPFSIEASINDDIPTTSIPFVCCHELSHLVGYMSETEANFLAFKACYESDHSYFKYSALLEALEYMSCLDYDDLPEKAKEDLETEYEYWNSLEQEAHEILSKTEDHINDTYLKSNNQTDGIVSYSLFIEYIIEYLNI